VPARTSKLATPAEAAALVADGDVVAIASLDLTGKPSDIHALVAFIKAQK